MIETETGKSEPLELPIVLLVDDDFEMRDALSFMLDELGVSVATARDGQEALDYLRSSGERPQLILLDLLMPGMDGYRFRAEQLDDPELASIPVVVLTGDFQVAKKAEQLGEVDCLAKPPGFFQLVDTIRRYVSIPR